MNLRTRLHLIAIVILIVGLGSAAWLYLAAQNVPVNMSLYEFEHSKRYVDNLQLYGGNMAVMEDDLSRWFAGLWHGTMLAYTVACMAAVLSGAFFLVAHHMPSAVKPGERSNRPR